MINRQSVLRALKLVVGGGLLFIVYRRVSFQELSSLLSSTRLDLLILFFVLLFTNSAVSALKWSSFLRADGIQIPYSKLLRSYLVGGFISLFLPSNIGGDTYRIIEVARLSNRTAGAFASVVADRLIGLAALALIGLVFGLLAIRFLETRIVLLLIVAMVSLLVFIACLFQKHLLCWTVRKTPLNRSAAINRVCEKVIGSVSQYTRSPRVIVQTLGLSILFQFNVILSIFTLSRALNLDIAFLYFCAFIPLISVIEALPVTVFGLGVRDVSYAFFFGTVGVERADALGMALAYVLLTMLFSAFGGCLFLWRTIRPDRVECPMEAKHTLVETKRAD